MRSKKTSPKAMILFHGAGGDRDYHLFLGLEDALEIHVNRINFPYRQKSSGKRPPDRLPVLLEAVHLSVEQTCEQLNLEPNQIIVGGRSMGGRVASIAVSQGLATAGLLLTSYPLHPSGKPEKLRVDHFPSINCPVLLVQGNRDPFGKPEEFAQHLPSISGPLEQLWIEGAHSPKESENQKIIDVVKKWIGSLR